MGIKIAAFDLETSHLSADFGVILAAVIIENPNGKIPKPIVYRLDKLCPTWKTARSNDKPLVERLIEKLSEYDVWIAHNGVKFDVPYIKTRAALWGLPAVPSKKIIDPVLLARKHLRLTSNRLSTIADFLKVNSKTDVLGHQWLKAMLDGDRKSMDYIVEHCVEDVKTLWAIVDAVKGYSNEITTWGSAR